MATEIAPVQGGAVVVPDDLSKLAGTGFEAADASDYSVPFLHILQKLSPQVDEGNSQHIKGARPGMIFETVSKRLFDGKEGLIVIPCAFKKSFVEWKPRESGGGFVKDHGWNEALASECTRNDKNRLVLPNGNMYTETKYHYILLAVDGTTIPAVISMISSQLKRSRGWMSLMQTRKMRTSEGKEFIPPMFAYTYNLTTVLEIKDQNNWYSWNIMPGDAAKREEVRSGYEFHKAVTAGIVKVVDDSPGLRDDDIPF